MTNGAQYPNKYLRFAAFVSAIVVFAMIAHIGWTFVVTGIARHNNDRMPSIGKITERTDRIALVAAYYQEKTNQLKPDEKLLVIAGSSLSYGYGVAMPFIFSKAMQDYYQDRHYRVVNMGLQSMGESGLLDNVLCPMRLSPAKADSILLEIPLINENSYQANKTSAPENMATDISDCDPAYNTPTSYYEYFFKRPWGFTWVSLLQDDFRWNTVNVAVGSGKLPKNWIPDQQSYARVKDVLFERRKVFIDSFASVTDNLIVFQSPFFVKGLTEMGFDQNVILQQINDAYDSCTQSAAAQCLNTEALDFDRDMFRDVGHLNLTGHQYFAEWLMKRALLK